MAKKYAIYILHKTPYSYIEQYEILPQNKGFSNCVLYECNINALPLSNLLGSYQS